MVVGTSTTSGAIALSKQRKSISAAGLFWAFYSNGTNMVYRTSTDGISWSSATTIRAAVSGELFSIEFDGLYLHYVYASASSLYYRRGLPNSNGTITWSATEQTVVTATNIAYSPFISVDSQGYVWIGYTEWVSGMIYRPFVIKSGNNDGTWGVTPGGFPYQLSATSSGNWEVSLLCLTAGKMLAIYGYVGTPYRAKRWDGSSWGSEVSTSSNTVSGCYHSAVAEGDDVHLVFLKSDGIVYTKYSSSTNSFGTEIYVYKTGVATAVPVLSRSTYDRGNLYCFWSDAPTTHHIYYKKYVDGVWDANPTDWVDESAEQLVPLQKISCFYFDYSHKIGLLYVTNTSPYSVKFVYLSLPPVTDARSNTKVYLETYIENANLTKDDDATIVSCAVIYAYPNYPLVREFYADSNPVDLLFLIETPNSTPLLGSSPSPYGYEEHVPIVVSCIDKTGITGTKLRWKAVAELRRITETYPAGSRRSLTEERPFDEHLDSTILHQQRVILNYRRATS